MDRRQFLWNFGGGLGGIAALGLDSKLRDHGVKQALLLSLGDCAEFQLPARRPQSLIDELLRTYRYDSDRGLHAAVDWLLRQRWELRGELQRIAGLCHTQQMTSGEVLFQKGDAGDALFGVRRGQVRIETGASDGSRLTLNFMGPGDLFGEVAVMDGQNRTADATAGEASELFVLRREDFLSFLEREPKVAIKIIMLLCQRIRWQSERMEESMLQPLPVRLARRLCALASDFGSEVHISQEQLGVFVGAARESVNRQLQTWRKDGILALQRGRILLQNLNKLASVARND